MYEMLTGKLPFDGDNPVSVALAHLEEPVQPPSRINPEVSASLDRIILNVPRKSRNAVTRMRMMIADLRHALVDPNDDFLKKEPEFDENSPTVVRGAEELNRQMEAQRNRNLEQTMEHPAVSEKTGPVPTENERGEVVWKEPEPSENEIEGWQEEETDVYEEETSRRPDRRRKGRRIEEDSEDVNPQMERLLTMIGIGAAVLIVVVVIVIAAKLTGIFNLGSGSQKHPKTTVEASSEASESESLESTECRVPPLDGMTEDEAKTALEKQSLKIRYEYEKSETSEKGKVIGQSIASGTVVSKQTEVIVTIGEGNEAIDLTKLGLEEMSSEEAETLLAEENKLTVVVQKESSDTVASGIVIRYSPSSVDPGGTVTLYVSTGPIVPTVPMPRITFQRKMQSCSGSGRISFMSARKRRVQKWQRASQDVLKTDTPGGKCHWLYSQSGKRNPPCGGDQR